MIKFQNLGYEDYEDVLNGSVSSDKEKWFRKWIEEGVFKHPKQDVSQSSFQKFLNKIENVPEDCSAYNILREFKDAKKYKLLKMIRVCSPNNNLPVKEQEEIDVADVKVEEAPKIVTDSQPQQVIHKVESVEVEAKPIKPSEPIKSSKKGGLIITIGIVALMVIVVIIKSCIK